MDGNKLIVYEQFITRADERVCAICGPLHGKIYAAGTGPQPPLHPNCRCKRIYHHTETGYTPPADLPPFLVNYPQPKKERSR